MNGKGKYRAWKLLLLLFFVHPLPAFAQQDPHSFTVTLKIDSAKPGDTVYFSYSTLIDGKPVEINDTAIYKTGDITFKGSVSDPGEATIIRYYTEKVDTASQMKMLEVLKLSGDLDKELIEMFLNPRKPDLYTFFLLPGETKISTPNRFFFAKAEGPEALTSYIKLKEQFNKLNEELTASIYSRFGFSSQRDAKTEKQLSLAYDSIRAITRDSVYLKYANENPGSQVSLFALWQSLPRPVDSADKYISVLRNLSPVIQQSHSAKRLFALLEASKKIQIGQIIADFQQPDSTGKKISLSSFRGKYVLIELWASWCVPCRKKNPGLKVIQDKYAGKNFTILGVALEERGDRIKWLDAIKKDQLSWPQLSDFKGWDNAVARQFGVQSIPFNILIDPKGTIIAKNVYEEELDTILRGVLK